MTAAAALTYMFNRLVRVISQLRLRWAGPQSFLERDPSPPSQRPEEPGKSWKSPPPRPGSDRESKQRRAEHRSYTPRSSTHINYNVTGKKSLKAVPVCLNFPSWQRRGSTDNTMESDFKYYSMFCTANHRQDHTQVRSIRQKSWNGSSQCKLPLQDDHMFHFLRCQIQCTAFTLMPSTFVSLAFLTH